MRTLEDYNLSGLLWIDLYAVIDTVASEEFSYDNYDYDYQMSRINVNKFIDRVTLLATYILTSELSPAIERLTDVKISMRSVILNLRSMSYINGQLTSIIISHLISQMPHKITSQTILNLMAAGYDGRLFTIPEVIERPDATYIEFSYITETVGFRGRTRRTTVKASVPISSQFSDNSSQLSDSILNINFVSRFWDEYEGVYVDLPYLVIGDTHIILEQKQVQIMTGMSNGDLSDYETMREVFEGVMKVHSLYDEEFEDMVESDDTYDDHHVEDVKLHSIEELMSSFNLEADSGIKDIMKNVDVVINDYAMTHSIYRSSRLASLFLRILRSFEPRIVNNSLLSVHQLVTLTRPSIIVNRMMRQLIVIHMTEDNIRRLMSPEDADDILYMIHHRMSTVLDQLTDMIMIIADSIPDMNIIVAYYAFKRSALDTRVLMERFMAGHGDAAYNGHQDLYNEITEHVRISSYGTKFSIKESEIRRILSLISEAMS